MLGSCQVEVPTNPPSIEKRTMPKLACLVTSETSITISLTKIVYVYVCVIQVIVAAKQPPEQREKNTHTHTKKSIATIYYYKLEASLQRAARILS